MKAKTILFTVVIVAGLAVGAGFYFMNWHNNEMEALQEKCDTAIAQAQEEDERCKEVEAALDEIAKKNKNLEDTVETIKRNRDAWKNKTTRLETTLNDLKKKYTAKETIIESAEIEHQIREINELAVIEYKYRHTSVIDDHDTFKKIIFLDGTSIPFTQKRVIISMDGTIKAGIDADKVTVNTDNRSKKITIGLPDPQILSNELDENSLYVYLEEDTIFNKVKAQDHSNLRQKIKDESQNLAKENGVMEQATERVKLLIRTMLEQIPDIKDNYTIEFEKVK